MNTDLTKHIRKEEGKTKEESIREWMQAWENSRYLLGPVLAYLNERLQTLEPIDEKDFETPNHYPKLVFRGGRKKEIQDLINIMPKSLKE